MSKKQTKKPTKPDARSENGPHAGPLQSKGLTEIEMIELAINTKPPRKRQAEPNQPRVIDSTKPDQQKGRG